VSFYFLNPTPIAVAVSRVAEKHYELLFSADNSDAVYIRTSKIPYIGATCFEALFGSPGRSVTSICPSPKSLLLCLLAVD